MTKKIFYTIFTLLISLLVYAIGTTYYKVSLIEKELFARQCEEKKKEGDIDISDKCFKAKKEEQQMITGTFDVD